MRGVKRAPSVASISMYTKWSEETSPSAAFVRPRRLGEPTLVDIGQNGAAGDRHLARPKFGHRGDDEAAENHLLLLLPPSGDRYNSKAPTMYDAYICVACGTFI